MFLTTISNYFPKHYERFGFVAEMQREYHAAGTDF
jgi:hypothetical protein